jgi:hypothetical protein
VWEAQLATVGWSLVWGKNRINLQTYSLKKVMDALWGTELG